MSVIADWWVNHNTDDFTENESRWVAAFRKHDAIFAQGGQLEVLENELEAHENRT